MVELTVKLNKRQTQAISSGEQLVINVLPASKTRAQNAIADARDHHIPKQVQLLIDEWNNHPFVREIGIGEARNNQITKEESRKLQIVFQQAIADYDRAIELDPNKPYAYYSLGMIHYKMGMWGRAKYNLNKFVARGGGHGHINDLLIEIEKKLKSETGSPGEASPHGR